LVSVKAAAAQDVSTIHVYGPGGPSQAMLECAHTFNVHNGANVIVTFGPTADSEDRICAAIVKLLPAFL
jgi:accessory colonization factor AcfC